MKTFTSSPLRRALLAFALVFGAASEGTHLLGQPSAGQAQNSQPAPAYKVGTITIKFVGTANVNEQVVRANMQLRENGEFDEVSLDKDIRSLYRTGLRSEEHTSELQSH